MEFLDTSTISHTKQVDEDIKDRMEDMIRILDNIVFNKHMHLHMRK